MRAYREFVKFRDWVNGPETAHFTDEQTDRATDGFDFYIDRIVSAPSQNPADTACRFLAVTEDYEALYGNPHREALEAEALALVG